MLGYLGKVLLLFIFSLFVIYQYYFQFNHIENFNGYTWYIIMLFVVYGIYKWFQLQNKDNDIVSYSIPNVIGYAGLHLFLLCTMFFVYQDMHFSHGFILFSKIIVFLILPTIISLISISTGKIILSYIDGFYDENKTFQNIMSLVFGFFLVLITIVIIGMIGFYNIYSVTGILFIYALLSFDKIKELLTDVYSYRINFSKSEGYGVKLLSTEFLFILSTLLLSINLISAFRPFPIGWDDLGAYMNYAQLLAQSGEIFNISSMFSWQIFTGIGYIFNSPTQAFFLNNLGGILSFILMIAIFSDLLKSKTKKFFINIPLLLATIFISMPMFIFEQAKDMKLDPGLYFVSISSVYLLIKLLLDSKENNFKNKILSFFGNKSTTLGSKYIYYIIVGILAGFAFSIKVTSLLLISGLIGLLFYARLGIYSFFGFIAIYFAIFTKFGLWKLMNVVYPSSDITFVNTFSLISFLLGVGLLGYGFSIHKNRLKTFFIKLLSLFSGILIALLPWFVFNYSSADDLSISTFISGKSERLEIDYSQLYSVDELEGKRQEQQKYTISATGTTGNEDWGRYFGYEEGINNYVKLPWNLSMQVNQKGEFTDITYIYFALLPLILLFLPFRKKYLSGGVLGIFFMGLLLFVFPSTSNLLTSLLSKFTLPGGYLILFLGFLIPLVYLLFSVKDSGKGKLFKYTSVFAFFYTFLWTIASYGVVWYGIVMYFCFLLIIGTCFYYVSGYENSSSEKEKQSKLLGTIVVFIIIAIYFFSSSFPHAFINLKQAAYKEFKTGDISSIEAPYMYHKDYLKIIYELNIEHSKKDDFINTALTSNTKKLIDLLNSNEELGITIYKNNIENLVANLRKLRNNNTFSQYHSDISKSLQNLYEGITYPTKEFKNTKSIYRIGTFLKYYISENNKRLLEDDLLINFDTYIKGSNPNKTVENMKKLGLNYLLVDLNAATIDNDPRKNLTKRYEGLLRTFTADNLEFVSSDSICLRLAREGYMKGSKGVEGFSKYMTFAGVNYNSYNPDGSVVRRQDKQIACYNQILTLIQEGKVNNTDYAYLLPIQNYIIENESLHGNTDEIYKFLIKAVPLGYKVLFRIAE